jgi:outer membrane lipoprotein-sorting protein
MKHKTDEHWLDAMISQAVDIGKAEFDRKAWLDRLAAESQRRGLTGTGIDHTQSNHLGTIWRKIMESKATKYSAAAVIALAAALVLMNPFGVSQNGVLLAAVQEKIAQVDTMILRGQTTFTSVSDPNISVKYDNVKYMSRQYGFAEDWYIKGTLTYRIILNRPEKQALLLLSTSKKYVKFPCTEEQIKVMERLTPTGVVDLLLETEYKKLGTATIDGVEAEGFEVQDLKSLENIMPKYLMDLQKGTATIWVDTKELLPIRMEGDMLLGKTFATLFTDVNCHEVAALEKYNVELDPGLFSTNPPEGYTPFSLADFIPVKLSMAGLGVVPAGCLAWQGARQRRRADKLIV